MRQLLHRLWDDDRGALIAVEWIVLVTILVIGLIVGFKTVQGAVLNEFGEIADALGSLSQSFSFGGTSGCCAFSGGSFFTDTTNLHGDGIFKCVGTTDTVSPIVCDD